jgi:hypothetical protein
MRYVNIEKLKDIVPSWAADVEALGHELNRQLWAWLGGTPIDPRENLSFWFELVGGHVRLAIPGDDGVDLCGWLIIADVINPLGSPCQVEVPLNTALEGYPPLGGHSVYMHAIGTEVGLHYIGVTKQRWHARMAQHISDARAGSPYVFHRSLAQHAGKRMLHKLLVPCLPYEKAMEIEEEFVGFTLYPKGMNMIPGGFAGIRYLASLGVKATNIKQRDTAIQRLVRLTTVKGNPNPLCAARWQSDQDYVNRIICGHGGRLTVEQVRQIRLLSDFGLGADSIVAQVGSRSVRQVKNVVAGRRYGRVA